MLLQPQELPALAASDISKDIGRTFPSHRRFAGPAGQEALRRVLHAYAAHDPEVAYCQVGAVACCSSFCVSAYRSSA